MVGHWVRPFPAALMRMNDRFGSWPCENSGARGAHRIFRRNCGTRESNHAVYITSCTALENYIFLISPKHEFSHSLGQNANPSLALARQLSPAPDKPPHELCSALCLPQPD